MDFNDSGFWFLKGYDDAVGEEVEDAMDSYRKSIQLDVYNVDSMLNLSALYEMQQRYAVASRWYQLIIKIDPEYLEAYYGYALC